jgi:hypothetical protein
MTEHKDAAYHRGHMNDPEEWESEAEIVVTQPSGMSVFSLRIPVEELQALRATAKRMKTTVSELVRAALRAQLTPATAEIAIQASDVNVQILPPARFWFGGMADAPPMDRALELRQ